MSKGKDKESSAGDAVLKYLRAQNRPYSVNDIFNNLHKEHGKTAVQKGLDKLVEDGSIREKVYGKQKVYLVDQSHLPTVKPEEISAMESQIVEKENLLKETEGTVKALLLEQKDLVSSLTKEEATNQLNQLNGEIKVMEEKYKKLSERTTIVDPEERKAQRNRRATVLKEWRTRKRTHKDIIDMLMESYPGTKKALFEDIGVETDEDVGVIFPTD